MAVIKNRLAISDLWCDIDQLHTLRSLALRESSSGIGRSKCR